MLPGHRNNAKTSCRRGRESVQWGWGSVDPGLTPTRSGEPTAAGSLVGGRGGGGGAWGITRDQTASRGLEGITGQQAFSLSLEDPCP